MPVTCRIPVGELDSLVAFWNWLVRTRWIPPLRGMHVELELQWVLWTKSGAKDYWWEMFFDYPVARMTPAGIAARHRGVRKFYAVLGGLRYGVHRPRDPSRGFLMPIWSDRRMAVFEVDPWKQMRRNPKDRANSICNLQMAQLLLAHEFVTQATTAPDDAEVLLYPNLNFVLDTDDVRGTRLEIDWPDGFEATYVMLDPASTRLAKADGLSPTMQSRSSGAAVFDRSDFSFR